MKKIINKIAVKKITILIVLILLTITGCKKYPEGPSISFKSAEKRLVNAWKFQNIARDGNDITSNYANNYIEFNSSGTTRFYTPDATYSGTWTLNDKNKNISITLKGFIMAKDYSYNFEENITMSGDIVMLKSKEIKFNLNVTDYLKGYVISQYIEQTSTSTQTWDLIIK